MKKKYLFIFAIFVSLSLSAQKKYFSHIDLRVGANYNYSVDYSFGIKPRPDLFVGAGTGLGTAFFVFNENGKKGDVLFLPLCLDAEYSPFKALKPLFFSLRAGGELTATIHHIDPVLHKVEREYKLVGFVAPGVGARVRLTEKFALRFALAAHFRTSSTYSVWKQGAFFSMGVEF